MPTRDLVHRINALQSIASSAVSTNTTINGNSVDSLGYEAVTALVRVSSRTDGTFTFKLQTSLDGSTNWTDLGTIANPPNQVIGGVNAVALTAVGDALLGASDGFRYFRVVCTSTLVTTGGAIQADIILGFPRHSGAAV